MDRVAFEIFEPDGKKFRLTPNWIVLGLWAFSIAFLWLFDNVFPPHGSFRTCWLALVFLITMYYLISSFFRHRPLNGKITGKIEVQKDRLIINDEVFELKDMTGLDFQLSDFYDMQATLSRDFNPKISQGVANSVTFKDPSGKTHLIYFRLPGKHSYLSFSDFINEAINTKKMSYYRGLDLIGEENITI